MALEAIRVNEIEVAAHMAIRALQRSMLALQREVGTAVVERHRFPCREGVTHRTVVIKIGGGVIRICDTIVIRRMALITIGIYQPEVAVDVT